MNTHSLTGSRYATLGVLGGAYLKGDKRGACLSHVYDFETDTVLCGRVATGNYAARVFPSGATQ